MRSSSDFENYNTILVVDDVSHNLEILRKILSDQGYKVFVASSGSSAIDSALKHSPDLILLDILMPDMDGYEVCRILKNKEKTQNIPIIFVSTLSEPIDKVKAFSVGGTDYLTKPLYIEEVLVRVEHQLRLHRMQRELIDQTTVLEHEIRVREQAEKSLRQAMREVIDIKFALDQSSMLAITDANGYITYANDHFCKISKYARHELIGQTHRILNSGFHSKEFFQLMWQTIRQGKVWKSEVRNRAKDGSFYWVDTVVIPLLGEDGVPNQYVAICKDISDRGQPILDKLRATLAIWQYTQTEDKLKLLESVVVNANDAVLITEAEPFDEPGPRILYVNEAFTKMTGYRAEEVLGKTPRILQGPKTSDAMRANIRAALESWQPFRGELLNYTKNGSEFWVDLNITPRTNEQGLITHWIAIQRDMSDRKAAELTLQRQAQIIDQVHDPVLTTDLRGVIMSWNKGAENRFGYSSEEVIGQNFSVLFLNEQNEFFQNQILQPLLQKGSHEVEVEMLTQNQDKFLALLSLSVLKNEGGESIGMISYIMDISDRKRAELEILKNLEKERELNDLRTRFITMVSHEYRTPLATILSSLELLEYYGHRSTEQEKKEYFQQIRISVQRMTDLLSDVLTLEKSAAGKLVFNPARLDLKNFCQDLVAELQSSIKTEHRILFSIEGQYSQVEMDANLMRYIFSNLISNAVKYSPQEGIIKFNAICQDPVVTFYVQDQGIGIPPEAIQNLFESFFRANNVGNVVGTGLGLSIVKRLVDIHGGSISVESEIGCGTVFTVVLPLHSESQIFGLIQEQARKEF
ncbi:MAG: PAS domain S-box protein [Thermosynechococcaceae cyanobacterium MS004]|nr:PAS domain S-box protein [Thermosynechococcaceae cyanobacterium MS004]